MPETATPVLPTARLWRRLVGSERLILAVLCAVALLFRFRWGLGWVEPADFFAYLTIQSNLAFVVVTAWAGVIAWRGIATPRRFDAIRAGVLTCTVTAGIVYALIVQQSTVRGIQVNVPWSDVILHFVLPVLAIADWMLTPRSRVPKKVVLLVLAYVGVWGVGTMIRGSITGWYPYYFLDPNQTNGIAEFLLLSSAAVAIFVAVGFALIVLRPPTARYPTERKAPGSSGPSLKPPRRRHPRFLAHSRHPRHPEAPDDPLPVAD